MMKRGRYNRPFLHLATLSVLGIGISVAPFLADTYPVFSQGSSIQHLPSPSNKEQSITIDNNVFQTVVSDKRRSGVITYSVGKGDTLSTIASKFDISGDTIKWANNLTSDDLSIGQQLKILPISGVLHKVSKGETVYSIAQKYKANPQEIVDWPYNDFANPETFSLVDGQLLIVPDGTISSEQSPQVSSQPTYAQHQESAPTNIAYSGGFQWPLQGDITQYFSWFHPGIDIAGSVGTPIYAAKSGVVAEASCGWNYGYGCHVVITHAAGFTTMYAHMVSSPSVSVGQSVSGGQLIGYRGSTGRSTGAHLHFEIRTPGGNVNPLKYLQ